MVAPLGLGVCQYDIDGSSLHRFRSFLADNGAWSSIGLLPLLDWSTSSWGFRRRRPSREPFFGHFQYRTWVCLANLWIDFRLDFIVPVSSVFAPPPPTRPSYELLNTLLVPVMSLFTNNRLCWPMIHAYHMLIIYLSYIHYIFIIYRLYIYYSFNFEWVGI